MVRTLIEAYPKEKRTPKQDGSKILKVAECFYDTIQGENFTGIPSIFLRLQGCTLSCVWCDTAEVWRQGNDYSVDELIQMFDEAGIIKRLKLGHHLVITGGSPMKQQEAVKEFLMELHSKYLFTPFVEVENECTLMPDKQLTLLINRWNNSPKLTNSKMKKEIRYKPEILKFLSKQKDSWFKFVIKSELEWKEINDDFLKPGLIKKEQIVLMPEGMTRDELREHYIAVVDLACKYGVRMTDRLHVTIWNKKTGV